MILRPCRFEIWEAVKTNPLKKAAIPCNTLEQRDFVTSENIACTIKQKDLITYSWPSRLKKVTNDTKLQPLLESREY